MTQKRTSLHGGPRSYKMSPNALAALESLCLALDLPRSRVLELSVLRLQEEWRAGRLRGITLDLSPEGTRTIAGTVSDFKRSSR